METTGENSLLVLGNGFDQSFGLKTGYKDFLSSNEFATIYHNSLGLTNSGLINTLHQRNTLENWIDVELAIKQFAIHYSRSSNSDVHATKIRIEFNYLKEGLLSYLSEVINTSDLSIQSSFKEFSKKISGKPLDIMNFNYTDVFSVISDRDNMKTIFSNIKSANNIHGTLEDRNIIFGIDGTQSDDVSDKITFLEKESNINYKPKDARKLLSNANEIFFYGVSLGETDRRYYQPFFQELLNSSKEKKMFFSFYGDESRQYLHNILTCFNNSEFKIQCCF